ncbi:phosphotransferase family protein [Serratia quinivorans]|uniref:phosphotransferase family protein n=1 Tax=Serratia quinivorans TaxID=137545 RepID=UPI00217976CD|nr:aminoglycoside phosphotransferase family protein [Serratia quinivorans]CAI0839885.1 methylthioribose kinase [Serratia quinivorans]CAI1608006.1 methylthioribose kinase [Serratia quinivorans]
MIQSSIATVLIDSGLISPDAVVTTLSGGVSCDTVLIRDRKRRYVAKRALAKLRVKQEWLADVSRNETEQAFLTYLGERLPGSVPHLVGAVPEQHMFMMEFVDGLREWKGLLMQGECNEHTARSAGSLLGNIHCVSWGCPEAGRLFATDSSFHQLRLGPYFEALISRYPALSTHIQCFCQRLMSTHLCLVHGDFSPKNLLVSDSRVVAIDGEVAWYGDPTFDLGFILSHLLLKSIHKNDLRYCELAVLVEQSYREAQPEPLDQHHLVNTLLLLLLARVDGKSPAEYLISTQRDRVRELTLEGLQNPPASLALLLQRVATL